MSLEKLKNFGSDCVVFIKAVAADDRIPSRDKKVILACLALVVSPLDLIPDWIPIIGILDDIVLIAIVLDYFFDVLDQDIILSHFPWSMKTYTWLRRTSRMISRLTPTFIKSNIWKFEGDVYKRTPR